MKTKPCFISKTNFLLISLFILIFSSCKKDYSSQPNQAVHVSNISDLYSTDGTLTVQLSILPPATPPSFIPNGGTSTIQYQVTSNKAIAYGDGTFSATYPAIERADIGGIGQNQGGNVYVSGMIGFPKPGNSTVTGTVYYNPVDSITSGTIAQVKLTSIWYLNGDETASYIFGNIGKAGEAPTMCLVNNIPHIQFQSPADDTLKNGYPEIAQVVLTGDTGWVLNSLPLSIFNPSSIPIPYSKLIVRVNNVKVAVTGKPIEATSPAPMQTVLHFTGGFKHIAGKTEVLKIYADVPYHDLRHIYTTMQPLKSFEWIDGLGKLIGGKLNAKYYTEQTGEAAY